MSPQRERQLRLQADGKCIICANPRGYDGSKHRCLECRARHNQQVAECKKRKSDRAKRARESAISLIIEVAAELVRGDGIPDAELSEFKPIGKHVARQIEAANHRRGLRLIKAMEFLKLKAGAR